MKEYGSKKSTEYSRKQIGVIFANAKRGNLKVEKWLMSEFYNTADYYGYDDGKSVEQFEGNVLDILSNVFSNNIEKAQELIDELTETEISYFSNKRKATIDRTLC